MNIVGAIKDNRLKMLLYEHVYQLGRLFTIYMVLSMNLSHGMFSFEKLVHFINDG